MANHKSALKRAKRNKKRNLINRATLSNLRTELKKFNEFIDEKNIEALKKNLPLIHKVIDKSCSKGVLKKNAASRRKSRLSVLVNQIAKEA